MTNIEAIKTLREQTGLSITECQRALEAADGDHDQALLLLKEKGREIATKKSGRALGAGVVVSYVHTGETVGVLLELLCETDFVAQNPEFRAVARDIAMHIAAMTPGDLATLLEQPFIKDPARTISDLVNNTVQKFGERTEIGHFTRFSIN